MNLPFSPACEENKSVILEAIKPMLQGEVLELGSGTGQHAVYFASQNPKVVWQTSELVEHIAPLKARLESSELANLPPPIALDALGSWPNREFDFIFSANCFHIMNHSMVEASVAGIASCLRAGGMFAVYGPFNYAGEYTSASNAEFDQWLIARNSGSGIKHFEWLNELAEQANLGLLDDIAMPAANRTIQKRTL